MDIVINFEGVAELLRQPIDVLAINLLLYVGWIPIVIFLLWMAKYLWLSYVGDKYGAKREFMLLAIDVPVGNEKSPRVVEHLFTQLAGAHGTINLIDKFWNGKSQDWFSFEIASIDGYTQFLIYAERKYRNFLEQLVYAQYSDAEITEVDDYTNDWPERIPDENYDIWGSEFILVSNNYLPLRTYLDFEHQFSGDFLDPLAAIMELFGSLRKGEQCSLQLVITPIDPSWEKGAPDAISKVIGEKKKPKPDIVDKGVNALMSLLGSMADFFIPTDAEATTQKEDDAKVSMQDLRPVQKKQMEAIQQKVSKVGFEVKIRWIYLAEHEVMDKTRANAFVGSMRQFGVQDLNAFKPDTNYTMTSTAYLRTGPRLVRRKNNLLRAFRSRSNYLGRQPMILNAEELATLWHFPVEPSVRAPLLQKVPSRKAVAPSYLPTEVTGDGEDFDWQSVMASGVPVTQPPASQPESAKPTTQHEQQAPLSEEEQDIFGEPTSSDEGNQDGGTPASDAPERAAATNGAPPPNLPIG